MDTRFFRSFSTEFMKIAADLQDADVRALLAQRRGEPYYPGGEIESNERETTLMRKLAFGLSSMMATQLGAAIPFSSDNKRSKKNRYEKLRETSLTALKGATGAVGLAGLVHSMRGQEKLSPKALRLAAGAGLAAAMLDRVYRDRLDKKKDLPKLPVLKLAAFVQPNASAPFRSAAQALAREGRTGGFTGRLMRKTGRPPSWTGLGKKYRMPTGAR